MDAPPASSPIIGAGASGTSSTAADGVLDGVAVVEAAVAADGLPTTPPADACCWEPDPQAGMVSGGGGALLEAEGEEALASKGWVKTCRRNNYTRENKDGAKLTWGPGPSSDPRSGMPAAVAAAAAAAVVVAAAPGVATVGLMVVAVTVAADPKVVVVEDSRPSARPGPWGQPPRSHQVSSDASGADLNQGVGPRQAIHPRDTATVASLPLTLVSPGAEEPLAAPLPLSKGSGPQEGL
jgi:hypothetical protein